MRVAELTVKLAALVVAEHDRGGAGEVGSVMTTVVPPDRCRWWG